MFLLCSDSALITDVIIENDFKFLIDLPVIRKFGWDGRMWGSAEEAEREVCRALIVKSIRKRRIIIVLVSLAHPREKSKFTL